MKNKKIILNVVIALAILIAVFLFYYYLSHNKFTPFSSQTLQSLSSNGSGSVLPVSPNDSSVTGLSVSYNFFGFISKITKINDNTYVLLKGVDKSIPVFRLDKNTPIFLIVKGISNPVKLVDLRESAPVTVSASYDIKTKNWVTTGVHVISGYLNTSTAK